MRFSRAPIQFVLWFAALGAAPAVATHAQGAEPVVGRVLPRWQPGTLDIHQISTGRGNAAFVVFPDGTTLLIDAGDAGATFPNAGPYPDNTRSTGDWIGRYIKRNAPDATLPIDYAMITHFHIDHIGAATPQTPLSADGTYRLAGIREVGTVVGIRTLIDRGWPDYSYPVALADSETADYRRFIVSRRAAGMHVEQFKPGSSSQIRLARQATRYRDFEVRNIVGNGVVWSGRDSSTTSVFPRLDSLPRGELPAENTCSLGIRISYGAFRYLTSGDVPGVLDPRRPRWHAIETAIAHAAGPVDVHVANHHGGADAESDSLLALLRSRVIVIPAWAPIHPAPDALQRMAAARPRTPLLFATDFRDSTGAQRTDTGALAAPPGHVVIRVAPGGRQYWVAVVSNRDESGTVIAAMGPFSPDAVATSKRPASQR
jgi:beta-lactamase superfamily II metal-dependent hydrolase